MQLQVVTSLQSYIKSLEAYKGFVSSPDVPVYLDNLSGYPLAECIRLFARKVPGRVWVICSTEEAASQLLKDGFATSGDDGKTNDQKFLYLPSNGKTLYSSWEGTKREYVQLLALQSAQKTEKGIIVTHLRAFVSPVVAFNALQEASLEIAVGKPFETEKSAEKLANGGYFRSPTTGSPGEFSIRGEVLDIFPHGEDAPVRIYADWDVVDKISYFDPVTQQTNGSMARISVVLPDMSDKSVTGPILPYLRENDYFFFIGDQRLESSFHALEVEAKALYRTAFHEDRSVAKPDILLVDFPRFRAATSRSAVITDIVGRHAGASHVDIAGPRSFFGDFTMVKSELTQLFKNGWNVTIFTTTEQQKARLAQMLNVFPQIVYVGTELSGGFSLPSRKEIVMCDHEIFGRRKQVIQRLHKIQSSPLDSFVDLSEGDYVVHANYGVGQFIKIDRVGVSGRERDYIKIRYASDENLYVPIEQANLIQRYIGSAGGSPALDHLGGQGWEHKKARARKSAEQLATRLQQLYARRKNARGFPFPPDTDWQLQFEASFPYDETEDQLTCIEDIKKDMESPIVMDRLVCGDVGYGKTEIAFRAAFKAVMSGKQVVFLAPTTILAEQHYNTFIGRLGDFPVRVGLLSRMVPRKEQSKVLKNLQAGQLDILFGTHRVIQKDVKFSDLGLLVVDEEQRFGVKDKERIKEMRTSVDSLSLSATPIPRTLYMSLLRIRDMSLLTTPPIARRPIRTIIQQYDPDIAEKAIRNELGRGGQVFYLHNRIETLGMVVNKLRERMPEFAIESAHGQMNGDDLEDTMRRFIHEGIQVLVSTTIIENGIDIPNVNTIIIDRADMYGVSQLYQLRGRVGRSDREACAYLFYPQEEMLSEIAIRRLQTISQHTELGGGFKVAMKDMEIRGTGNLLGREQSGQVASVGLDMFLKILDETISKMQNADDDSSREVYLELDYSGFIPDSYIKAPSVKFEIYRKIASISTQQELQALGAELADRFGTMPEEVANLLYIAELKIVCRRLSVFHLLEKNGAVTVEFSHVASLSINKVLDLVKLSGGDVKLDPKRPNMLSMKTSAVSLKDKALFILEKLQRLM